MNKYLAGAFYSLPLQMFLLHFRKYQVFLVFWYILFSTVNGTFMNAYGASSLYLAPEYLGKVNFLSTLLVGISVGIFIMSWNITTFILHGKHIKFLATTSQPFLKYCINNAVIPLLFLLFYLFKAIEFDKHGQLMNTVEILILIGGFVVGMVSAIFLSFLYFFGADRRIYRGMATDLNTANLQYALAPTLSPRERERGDMRVDWFFSATLKLRKPRDVRHYSVTFLNSIFKRHHIAAVVSIFIAFIFLLGIGFFMDNKAFQVPAAASITVFFSILIAVAGAFSLFFRTWSVFLLFILYIGLNWMYQKNMLDFRNRAYGLNYNNEQERPLYNRESLVNLASDSNIAADKKAFIKILDNWKAKQETDKPVMYIINVSGGGNRSATFTMNVLQHMDSLLCGTLMTRTMLINGSSGGMFGAAYFRELYRRKTHNQQINLYDKRYVDDISKDLLNPLFSSFVARDLTSPAQRFYVGPYSYVKDRGYSLEQRFNDNTHGLLDHRLRDYVTAEGRAEIPLMFFNSVITRDGRKLLISTHPARFLMKTTFDSTVKADVDPDIVDYVSYFNKQDPYNLRILSALRMNATFPYILPNVWLPTVPVIDVMDAGLRDNFGTENTLRFIEVFKEWLLQNTSKVVILQIRDRALVDWSGRENKSTVLSWLTQPLMLLQNNWFRIQDYYQADQLSYASAAYPDNLYRIIFQYEPSRKDANASLSFHLTESEKIDIAHALNDSINLAGFNRLLQLTNQ
jgi:hypothetical protein